MSTLSYQQLALSWKPVSQSEKQFKLIVITVVIVMLLAALIISKVPVPKKERQARVVVPERIANFILDKPRPKPVVKPKPKPKVLPKPKPKPEPEAEKKPKVKKIKEDKKKQKPLTQKQQKAREKAAKTGLLALGNELADLMDTSDVAAMVGGSVKAGAATGSAQSPGKNSRERFLADASRGSGGVNADEFAATTVVARSKLSEREITRVKQALLEPEALAKVQSKSVQDANQKQRADSNKPRKAGIRAEEGISIVFDQNKSKLYSIYSRARRKDPSLKGKIVLEITVAPSGGVTRIVVVSNELDDAKLESRLVNRIKQFNFGAQNVEEITITYPIEFLPS